MSERPLISIVDDDQSFGDSMRGSQGAGLLCRGVPVCSAFLASAELAATACLIADIHMPEMTGVELYNHSGRKWAGNPHDLGHRPS